MQISARSRAVQPGELVVLSIALPAPTAHVRVRAFGRDIAASPDGDREWRALVDLPGSVATARLVADYIAGMTDRFALDKHARLLDTYATTT